MQSHCWLWERVRKGGKKADRKERMLTSQVQGRKRLKKGRESLGREIKLLLGHWGRERQMEKVRIGDSR